MKLKNKIDCNNPEELRSVLELDSLKRNKHLNNIMRIFNDLESSVTLSLDGGWGTGKSVFAKKLEYLSNDLLNEQENEFPQVDVNVLNTFREQFDIYYFNSWEYDMYEKPLEIFLYDLIKHRKRIMTRQDKNVDRLEKVIKKGILPVANSTLKFLSSGTVDFDELSSGETKDEKLLKTATYVDDLKERINEVLKILTEEKKIVIIIDELDRCKPTFAVELLEVIKHYFSYEKISYIICSNKSQLSHTIKKYYGFDFDGFGYLDRFIDLEYNLPFPDTTEYLNRVLNVNNRSKFPYNQLVKVNCSYFALSLREINKYVFISEIIINRFKRKDSRASKNFDLFYNLIFPLYCFGSKLTRPNNYKNFLENLGLNELEEYIDENKDYFERILEIDTSDRSSTHIEDSKLISLTKEYYMSLFETRDTEPLESLKEALSLFN